MMATNQSNFQVPSWEGSACNPEAEQLSKALFQAIPSSAHLTRKKSSNRRNSEAKKKEPHSQAGDLVWSADYDKYFYSLDPGERVNVLLRKLGKYYDKSKSFKNDVKGSAAKRRKNTNRDVDRPDQAHILSANEGTTEMNPFDIKSDSKKDATSENSSCTEPPKAKKRKKKKQHEKQCKTNGNGDDGLLKAKESNAFMMKEDLNTINSVADVMHMNKGSRAEMVKPVGHANSHNGFHSNSSADSELHNGVDSKERKSSKVTKSTENRKEMEPKNHSSSAQKSARIRSLDLERGEQALELHSSPSRQKINMSFQSKLQKKLSGAQFRYINEQLYTLSSDRAHEIFTNDPSLFDVYHKGFQSQVQSWPQNPIDLMIKDLRDRSDELVVADMGCGDAKIAQNVKQKVHSFDLVAQNSFATACDMAKVPLNKESVDMVIFCLSLMGKNIGDFLLEASRIVKMGGILKIAEVVSRFDGIGKFIDSVSTFGFSFLSKDTSNRMFILMDFKKTEQPKPNVCLDISLKPCLYKKR